LKTCGLNPRGVMEKGKKRKEKRLKILNILQLANGKGTFSRRGYPEGK